MRVYHVPSRHFLLVCIQYLIFIDYLKMELYCHIHCHLFNGLIIEMMIFQVYT
jgi:hypothetical protein